MEIVSIIISLITGLALGCVGFYFINKTKNVSRYVYENLLNKNNETITFLKITEDRLRNIQKENEKLFSKIENKEIELSSLQSKSASLETVVKNYEEKNSELNNISTNQISINNNQQNEINVLKQKIAEINAVNNSLQEKLSTQKNEIIEIQKSSHLQFEQIANKIFEEKSGRFTETNKINIEALLKPLGENINTFKKKVEETYDKEAQQRFSLEQKVKELIEQTNKVSAEANNLATALKGQAKKQGNWGEVILESILQKSGLVKDREYFLQKNMKDEDGKNLRPDVLINLPDNRSIIIDSKVSLIAYDRFSSSEKTEEQTIHLSDHLKSIQNHINDLHGKKYDNLETSLDFTMMFIPIEPAYLLAIQADQELWSYAYSKRILLISPTNLIACLKLIADLWKREMQSKNAMEIVKRGELLYEKFVSFTESVEDIGKHIERSQTSYNNALNQLKSGSGNLVGQALKLKSLGLKSGKEIPLAMLPLDFDTDEIKEINKPQ
jgi:DNA recombination protein RmuC